MMSPFSACTWAMAPKSRIMLNISYICQERRGCPVSDKLWSLLWSAKLLLLHLGCLYYLGISALKFVFISHKNQEGVHTLKKENDTCIYYHSPERSTLVRAEQGCSTPVLCAGGLGWKQTKAKQGNSSRESWTPCFGSHETQYSPMFGYTWTKKTHRPFLILDTLCNLTWIHRIKCIASNLNFPSKSGLNLWFLSNFQLYLN